MTLRARSIEYSTGETLHYVGPDLAEGPLPAFFYFSLGGIESLTLDPFNQPVQFSKDRKWRIFSIDLPDHGENCDPHEAMRKWATRIKSQENFVAHFCEKLRKAVTFVKNQGAIGTCKVGVGGLSRGGFIAMHAAAMIDDFSAILGYAPLTRVTKMDDFAAEVPTNLALQLDADFIAPRLVGKAINFLIGNHDARVDTNSAIEITQKLIMLNIESGIKNPEIELHIAKSAGFQGHGTPPERFKRGIEWMADQLGAQSDKSK